MGSAPAGAALNSEADATRENVYELGPLKVSFPCFGPERWPMGWAQKPRRKYNAKNTQQLVYLLEDSEIVAHAGGPRADGAQESSLRSWIHHALPLDAAAPFCIRHGHGEASSTFCGPRKRASSVDSQHIAFTRLVLVSLVPSNACYSRLVLGVARAGRTPVAAAHEELSEAFCYPARACDSLPVSSCPRCSGLLVVLGTWVFSLANVDGTFHTVGANSLEVMEVANQAVPPAGGAQGTMTSAACHRAWRNLVLALDEDEAARRYEMQVEDCFVVLYGVRYTRQNQEKYVDWMERLSVLDKCSFWDAHIMNLRMTPSSIYAGMEPGVYCNGPSYNALVSHALCMNVSNKRLAMSASEREHRGLQLSDHPTIPDCGDEVEMPVAFAQ